MAEGEIALGTWVELPRTPGFIDEFLLSVSIKQETQSCEEYYCYQEKKLCGSSEN